MKLTVVVFAAVLAGCSQTGGIQPADLPNMQGRASRGATMEQMQRDGANCRNQARVVYGASGIPVRTAYIDCMVGLGYEVAS
jgi:hypothetical protein